MYLIPWWEAHAAARLRFLRSRLACHLGPRSRTQVHSHPTRTLFLCACTVAYLCGLVVFLFSRSSCCCIGRRRGVCGSLLRKLFRRICTISLSLFFPTPSANVMGSRILLLFLNLVYGSGTVRCIYITRACYAGRSSEECQKFLKVRFPRGKKWISSKLPGVADARKC